MFTKIKKVIPFIVLLLCCIIILYWAVKMTLKVELLEDNLSSLTGLITQGIIEK